MNADTDLLRRFADEGAQDAFAELVRDKIGLVYAAALRQTGGDAHLAQDVTQGVFLALACQAAALKRHAVLTGWLYTTTRFVAIKAVRTQARWQRREQEANAMNVSADQPDQAWAQLRPVIDEVLHELDARDRDALLLRFFEGRPLADVGVAIGLAENSARMRVDRALEKLRMRLQKRGITSTAVALAAVLTAQPAVMVPAGLATSLLASALAGAATRVGGIAATWAALDFMTKLKLASIAAAAFAAVGTGTYLLAQQNEKDRADAVVGTVRAELASLRAENQQLKTEVVRLQKAVSDSAPPPLAELHALVLAAQQKLVALPMASLLRTDKMDQLSPGVVALFNLSTEEKAAIEKQLVGVRSEIDALCAANIASTEHPSDNSVVMKFKPFPDAGGKVHDRFVSELAATLGEERFAALKVLMGDGFDWVIGSGFGAVERSIAIERQTVGPAGNQRTFYVLRDRTAAPAGSPPRTYTNVTAPGERAELNQKYPRLAALLPPDF